MDKHGSINMKAVLRLTGLTADTLRAWERRHGVVHPQRGPTGRRLYSQREVDRLRLLAQLVSLGHAIGTIAARSDRELIALLGTSRTGASSGSGSELETRIKRLLVDLAAFDLGSLKQGLARSRYLMSARDFVFDLIPALMVQVGDQIVAGELSVAQEHALSELVRQHLRAIYEGLEAVDGSLRPPRALAFATPEGNHHEFGLLMAAVVCRYRGLRTHYLGPNLPAESFAHAARRLKAEAVVLGVAEIPREEEKVAPGQYVAELEKRLPAGVGIWLGGSAASRIRRREKGERETYVFESLLALEQKLDLLLGKEK